MILALRSGLEMILSHMASRCFNVSPYRAIWHMDPFQTHFNDSGPSPGSGPGPGPGRRAGGGRAVTLVQ